MKIFALFLSLLLLCSCQQTPQAVSHEEAASYTQALWSALETAEDGAVFAQDLDLDSCPELYLLYRSGEYESTLQGIGLNGQAHSLGCLKMGRPADDVWWVAHCYNEEKAYLSIDTQGYACAADGNSCHTQHNITLDQDGLNSLDVLISEVPAVGTNYMIDGKVITDREEYNKAMKDFILRDGQGGSLDVIVFTEETLVQAVTDALTQWENKQNQ